MSIWHWSAIWETETEPSPGSEQAGASISDFRTHKRVLCLQRTKFELFLYRNTRGQTEFVSRCHSYLNMRAALGQANRWRLDCEVLSWWRAREESRREPQAAQRWSQLMNRVLSARWIARTALTPTQKEAAIRNERQSCPHYKEAKPLAELQPCSSSLEVRTFAAAETSYLEEEIFRQSVTVEA